MKMIPWWGVLLTCIGFALWTLLSAMVGAAIVMQAQVKSREKMAKEAGIIVPDNLDGLV